MRDSPPAACTKVKNHRNTTWFPRGWWTADNAVVDDAADEVDGGASGLAVDEVRVGIGGDEDPSWRRSAARRTVKGAPASCSPGPTPPYRK